MNQESEKEIINKLAVPVYEDALRPFAKEISNGLASVARSVNSGLYLMEECVEATTNVLRMTARNLSLLPPERISFSNPRVALQALDQSKFSVNETEIQELFSNLISQSLTSDQSGTTHPAYIEVIKQLTSDEALILKFMESQSEHRSGSAPTIDVIRKGGDETFSYENTTPEFNLIAEDAGCLTPENSWQYFENLKRLGLISHSTGTSFPREIHQRIFDSKKCSEVYEKESYDSVTFNSGTYIFTRFGNQFAKCCIRT